jgi:hypothetical protein
MNRHLQVSSFCGGLAILLALLGANSPANALNFQTFTDRTTWLNQLTGGAPSLSENFNSYTSDVAFGNRSVTTPSSITLSGNASALGEARIDRKNYVGISGQNNNFVPTGIDNTTLLNSRGLDLDESITVTLPSSLSAFGFDYENYDFNGDGLHVFIAGQDVVSIPGPYNTKGFIGIIADGRFNNVVFKAVTNASEVDAFNTIDNLEAGTAAGATAVPFEFSPSLGLLAVGSIWGAARWRKHRTAGKILEIAS